MKRTSALCSRAALALTVSIPFAAPAAYANPTGGMVSAGAASVSQSGSTLTVNQTSNKAVINWTGFDIAAGETTDFIQPSASAIALNRVNSNSPSSINGNLNANGNIVIINQNGVLFGAGAKVDVGGLIATTADIGDAAFMNSSGKLSFNRPGNPDAAIVNNGMITVAQAGLAGFVAPNVVNNGVITATLGRVQLASGDTVTVDLYGDHLMEIAVSDQVKSQLVANSGLIAADGGKVALTAAAGQQIVNALIANSGELRAQSVGQKNGEIIISALGSNAVKGNVTANKGKKAGSSTVVNSGIIDASGYGSGQTGGSIAVLGDNVGILSGSLIDASGDAGGGTIKIGGDFHGAGNTPTALNTYVDANALILANANTSGNGGNVAVWSDGNTWFLGNILAEGGAKSGNGGFVETSGHGYLDSTGYVDLLAMNGQKGTWLLDPTDISIYGGVNPAFVATDGSINLASSLQLWLDASDQSKVQLTYNDLSTTATGNSGQNTITVGSNTGLAVGERIQIGGNSDTYAASINDNASGSGIYTITAINGTTVTLDANLAASQAGAEIFGGYVSQISDKSGNGYNATQATAANMPLWVSNGQNGIGTMMFNGSSDYITSPTAPTIGTLFQVASNSSSNFVGFFTGNTDPGGTNHWFTGYNSSNPLRIDAAASYISTYYVNGANTLDYASGISNIFSGTANFPSSGLDGYRIGLDRNNAGRYLDGSSSEVIAYSNNLSTNAQALINQYQSAKWGIALTPPGSGATEATQAMASTARGDATDGYSVFSDAYLVRLSQSANIDLDASHNITIDLQGDTMTLAAGRNLTLSAGNDILSNSSGTITTSQSAGNGGNIIMKAGADITLPGLSLNSGGGAITLDSNTAGSGGAIVLSNSTVSSGGGNITLGGGADPTMDAAVGDTANNYGVSINGTTVTGGNGAISIIGTGYANSGQGFGIYNTGTIQTTNGNIVLVGNGGEGGVFDDSNYGINSNGTIQATGSGAITLTGTGHGNGSWHNYGVNISGTVSTNSNTLTINGTGAQEAGANGYGYGINIGATITSNSGNIVLNGKGGLDNNTNFNYGIYLEGNNTIATGTGNITLTGIQGSGANSYGIYSGSNNTIGGAAEHGNISIITDQLEGTPNSVQTSSNVTIAPYTASTAINVANGTNGLAITSDILGDITAGSLTIGNTSDTGAMTLGAFSSWTQPTTFITGNSGNIIVSGAQAATGNGSFTFTGPTTLDANITTADQDIIFNSDVLVGSSSVLDAGNGTVSFSGAVNGITAFSGTVEALVVGGGGGGGTDGGGGGGAGGVIYDAAYTVAPNAPLGVTVGVGGAGTTSYFTTGASGSNSLFGTITALGGGGGASRDGGGPALAGGSGGGGGGGGPAVAGGAGDTAAGSGTNGQGNNGGNGFDFGGDSAGGGGGGAGGAGTVGAFDQGGTGGSGIANSISGASVIYGGGGGGGLTINGTRGLGGTGGAGNGGDLTHATTSATANTGSGGGGGGMGGNPGSNGGSGVVIVSYATSNAASVVESGASITTSGSNTIATFNGNGSFETLTGCGSACNLTVSAGNMVFGGALGGATPLGAVSLTSANSLTLPSIHAASIFARTTGAAADITLSNSLTTSGAGNAIVLAAARNFINDAGAGALSTPSGRWIMYSNNIGDDTLGGLAAPQVIGQQTYGSLAPAAITGPAYSATENTFVYNIPTGTIDFAANDTTSVYGKAPVYTYRFTCTTGCTELQAEAGGALSLTSPGNAQSPLGTYSIAAAQGSLTFNPAYSGYILNYTNATLSIIPPPIATLPDSIFRISQDALLDIDMSTHNPASPDRNDTIQLEIDPKLVQLLALNWPTVEP